MRYIESIFLGILIACTALFAQVFLSVFTEVLFRYNLTLQQSSAIFGFFGVVFFFSINAAIEEILRYTVIKKRVLTYIQDDFRSIMLHGISIGAGFWFFELILVYFRDYSFSLVVTSTLPVLFIHVLLSTFFISFLRKKNGASDILIIIIAIILHVASNSILYICTT